MNTLRKLIDENPITVPKLAEAIGVTRAGFHDLFQRGFTHTQAEVIEDTIHAFGGRLTGFRMPDTLYRKKKLPKHTP